ncbi:hypothetical protein F1737_02405 [Methanoplanus sp. FWC-SCC4]|uniref:Uncharacterized protein n=1 Tax=Methanochimaera problematica TaxID=2609417 RepID=A0AA97FBR0_9EURY|nr:hypothetical protein [Methanoplanus sp. FWC-SCC4]WOF15617.1 hypothetical protein F1737_02405 [Methanoplanus sp. FWC-SCC4]
MTKMSDSKRRLLMMLTIILAGSAVTFLELSPIIVLFIAVAIGVVMLFALQMITLDEIKSDLSNLKNKLDQPISLKKTDKTQNKSKGEKKPESETFKADSKTKEGSKPGLLDSLKGIFSKKKEEKAEKITKKDSETTKKSLFAGFSSLKSKIPKSGKSEEKIKEIDTLLDQALSGEGVSNASDENNSEDNSSDDDFSDFDNFDLGLDSEEEEGDITIPKSAEDFPGAALEEEIPDSAIADILAKEGIELELDDSDFPASIDNTNDEDSEIPDSGLENIDDLDSNISGFDFEDDDLGELDEIDLDEIETEDEIEIGDDDDSFEEIEIGDSDSEIEEVPALAPTDEEDILSAPPKEWEQKSSLSGVLGKEEAESNFDEPVSMAFGGGNDEDDLFAMLKSDTKKAVAIQEVSLVRNLKDTKIDSTELIGELEEIMKEFGIEITKKEEEITEEES